MSWDALVAFIRAEAPSFVASLEGVSRDDVARVEKDYGVHLPGTYKQFLLLMGEDSAGFHLFGPSQNQRFSDVVAQLPGESCPVQEYFKIAYADDESLVSPPDHYLDLTRSDGLDAPIVMFEGGEGFSSENVREKGFTFLEQAYRRLSAHLADDRLPERSLLTIPNLTRGQGQLSVGSLVTVLEEMHFHLAVQPLPRVSCLRRDGVWALVDVHAGGRALAISLWGIERGILEGVIDQLLLRFRDATVTDRGRPLTH